MKVSRNAPCPCGSGEKFKNCCGAGDNIRAGVAGGRVLAIIVGIAVIGGVVIAIDTFRTTDLSVQPYVYDAENDQYFDPVHGHMHPGRPPQNPGEAGQADHDGRAADLSGPAPIPWEYDAAKNQHYDPTHGHWHAGPPPNQPADAAAAPPAAALPPLPAPLPAAAEAPSGDTPGDWEYDAANDRHWNPKTGTWEAGMPPLEAFVSDDE